MRFLDKKIYFRMLLEFPSIVFLKIKIFQTHSASFFYSNIETTQTFSTSSFCVNIASLSIKNNDL